MRFRLESAAVVAAAAAVIALVACEKQSDLRAQNPNGVSLTSGSFDAPPPRPAPAPIDDTMGNPTFSGREQKNRAPAVTNEAPSTWGGERDGGT